MSSLTATVFMAVKVASLSSDCQCTLLNWYLTGSPRLGTYARAAFLADEQGQGRIYVPSIVLAEPHYLNVTYNRPLEFSQEYERLASAGRFHFVDFRAVDVLRFDALAAIPEMHDRIIARGPRRFTYPS